MAAGMDVDSFAPRLSFFFNSHIDFFEEIAKFRAARRIYARHMREKYGATQSALVAAALPHADGGLQRDGAAAGEQHRARRVRGDGRGARAARSRCTRTRWTKSWRCRREKSVEIALRTQQVLAYETNVTNVVDPLGGSYFVEALTDEMERQAESYFAQIAEYGGVIEAIEAGFFQREIAEASYRYQRSIETKDRIIVGVNAFVQRRDQRGDRAA